MTLIVKAPGSTNDGLIRGDNAVYATARSTSSSFDVTSNFVTVGQRLSAGTYTVWRDLLEFDTSWVDPDLKVNTLTLTMQVATDTSTTDFDVQIGEYNWTSPIAAGNREANYDGALTAANLVTWRNTSGMAVDTMYTSPALRTAWLNRTGFTRLVLLSSRDLSTTAPVGDEWIAIRSDNHVTGSTRPYLTITFAEPRKRGIVRAPGDWPWLH